MSSKPFHILFVCTGNLCRSPMAEWLLRLSLSRRLGSDAGVITTSSAGTHAQDGAPMHPYATSALVELDADPAGFAARPLHAADLAAADLVLTATRAHRAACVSLHPPALLRCFTLRQWHRLVGRVDAGTLPPGDPAARALGLRAGALAVRGTVQPVPPADDDLPDPLGRPASAFRACAAELADLTWRTSGLIAGS
jgi:protein-tyrosine phosphatase